MNHRQLVFQPMPGFTLITGSLLFRLCPFSFLYNSSSLLLWNGRNLHKYAFLSFVAPFPLNWPLESYGMCLPCKRNLSYFKRCSRSLVPSRLVDLPWNSPWTWVLTAVLVDLGYYWWESSCCPHMIQWFIVCCQYPAVFFSPNFGGDEQNQSKFVSS